MFRAYVVALLGYARLRVILAFSLMLLLGLTEGIGLLMLVPFLHLVGLSQETQVPSGIIATAGTIFAALGLPLTLSAVLGVYVTLIAFRALLTRWREVLLTDIRLGFVNHLRVRLYAAIGHASWLFLSTQRSADLAHAITSDINRVGEGTYYFLNLAVVAFMTSVYIAVALKLSALMTAIALMTGCVLLLLLWPQIRRTRQLGKMLTEADREVFRTVSELLDGIKLAKSYVAEDRHCSMFREAVTISRQRALSFVHRNALAGMVYQIGAALALSGLLFVAAEVVELPATELLVLVLVFARLLPMLSRMQRDYQCIVHMLPAFSAAMKMIHSCEEAAEQKPSGEREPLILKQEVRFHDVRFRYDKQKERMALAGVSLAIPARRTTALVGPSGAGKSTLADLLMGLLTPDTGKILVDGKPLRDDRIRDWRRAVAYVPQDTFLFHNTVRANLLWAQPQATDEDLWNVLKLVAADGFVADLPSGLDTVVGDRALRLSGGERQRLALARALLCRPSLLILDEATSALDTEHERRIQQAIDDLHGELTIVIIAHRLSTVRHADRIIVMDKGRVLESGTWDELSRNDHGRMRALLRAAALAH